MTISPPFPVTNVVDSQELDYIALLERARAGPEPDWIIYEFGDNRKIFWHKFNPSPIYEKPVEIVNGVTIHLPDPDLISTNP